MKIRRAEITDSVEIAKVQVDAWHQTYRGLIIYMEIKRLNL